MLTLVLGGASSGKSAFGEQLASVCPGPRVYLATMSANDPESLYRIQRHREQRAGLEFHTLEEPLNIGVPVPAGAVVLVEALTTLLANHLYLCGGAGPSGVVDAVLQGVSQLTAQAGQVILISDLIFSDGTAYDPDTCRYLSLLGELHRVLADRADRVVEVVYGIPCPLKGSFTEAEKKGGEGL